MSMLEDKLKRALNYLNEGNLTQAEVLFLQCVDKADDQKSNVFAQSMHGLAYVKMAQEHFDEAWDLYMRLLELAETKNDTNGRAIVHHQLGMVEQTRGHYAEALEQFAHEQSIYQSSMVEDDLSVAINLFEQGYVYFLMEDFEKASNALDEALDHAQRSDDPVTIASVHHALGDLAAQGKNKDKALEHYTEAQAIFQKENDSPMAEELTGKITTVSAW
ncbi:hypothetical protein JNUCC1_00288 [Lentibacillus sp. JNUCC-1]|uniref:tetratricopeptide repeat protein n=1 Tax=Lentibacillus sp. JNUCC-1 TaxID=2654513 RepID=UPI0012E8A138|nr:tetratricopeptide repeat protein [Lentibacillus sp. JNUCC-1]MUV36486.1 hypothetical protein [Lentibacillus sp. JNUCC-1]